MSGLSTITAIATHGALLARRLVDEIVLYFAPLLLGDGARGMFHLPHIHALSDRIALEIMDTRAVGEDWRVLAKVREK